MSIGGAGSAMGGERRSGVRWRAGAGYLATVAAGVALFMLIRVLGENGAATAPVAQPSSALQLPASAISSGAVSFHVVLTLTVVLALGALFGHLCRMLGQPPVIGEIFAGLMLGPSLLGAISPEAMQLLIPSAAVDPQGQVSAALKSISQLGVIIYMFLVGLELDESSFRRQAGSLVAISHVSIVVPFVLGSALALFLYPQMAGPGVTFTSFALFAGVSLAITALPVLARILADQKLERTPLGMNAISCAAIGDVTAWCLLALVIGLSRSALDEFVTVLVSAVIFFGAVFYIVRPLVERAARRFDGTDLPLPPVAISAALFFALVAALITEEIGIHALIGAFALGVVVPHDSRIARETIGRLHWPITVLFLPAFFACTGMHTRIGLISGWSNILWCAAIILAATVGKVGGTYAASRAAGYLPPAALSLGVLMNSRGLMELIVLNIGLELGVINETLFTMMVVMALITTLATVPALKLLWRGGTPPFARIDAAGTGG